MDKVTITGQITIDGEWDTLRVDGDCIVQLLCEDPWENVEIKEAKVFIRYFVSDEPFASFESAQIQWIEKVCGIEGESKMLHGSEWTGMYGWDQELTLGGHDLIAELRNCTGKYLALEMECAT